MKKKMVEPKVRLANEASMLCVRLVEIENRTEKVIRITRKAHARFLRRAV
jgi:hypothetical protein